MAKVSITGGMHVLWGEWVLRTSHLFSTLTNNTCHPPPYLYIYIYLVHLYLISILLIKWKTTELPVGYYSAHVCVSVIYCSGFDSECVTHPKPMLMSLTQLLELFIHIRHNNFMYCMLNKFKRLHCTTKEQCTVLFSFNRYKIYTSWKK